MSKFSQKVEDDLDATRAAESILRHLGYANVQLGQNRLLVSDNFNKETLTQIARSAERIARWARREAQR